MKLFNPSVTPQILTALDGHVITTREEWETIRRPEIVEMFQREVYGKLPGRPENLRFDVLEEHKDALDGKATSRIVQVSFDGPLGSWSFPFYLFIPKYDQLECHLSCLKKSVQDQRLAYSQKKLLPMK